MQRYPNSGGECDVAECDHDHRDGTGGQQFYQSESLWTSIMRDVASTVISK
jgi:hypothetical protein